MTPSGLYVDPRQYPELDAVTPAWRVIRDEALAAVPHLTYVADHRVGPETWGVLPFRVEADDRAVIGDDICRQNRARAPVTVGLVEALGSVEAFSFSWLAAGATIAEHRHHRPFVTAALCLAGAEGASIRVGGETRAYTDGEWVVFDYTQPHEVTNQGSRPRVVLLVLLEPRA